jgi:hypothetical protein
MLPLYPQPSQVKRSSEFINVENPNCSNFFGAVDLLPINFALHSRAVVLSRPKKSPLNLVGVTDGARRDDEESKVMNILRVYH